MGAKDTGDSKTTSPMGAKDTGDSKTSSSPARQSSSEPVFDVHCSEAVIVDGACRRFVSLAAVFALVVAAFYRSDRRAINLPGEVVRACVEQ